MTIVFINFKSYCPKSEFYEVFKQDKFQNLVLKISIFVDV